MGRRVSVAIAPVGFAHRVKTFEDASEVLMTGAHPSTVHTAAF